MKTKIRVMLASLAMLAGGLPNAQAAFVDAPVAANAFITEGGLQWAWAAPLPGPGNGLDLSFQSAFGWRMPTLSELQIAPDATDFIFLGANVPLGGADPLTGANFEATNAALTGAAACATPYFNTVYRHCDWQDGQGQVFGPWAGPPGAQTFADQLVVRSVPEPGTLALLGLSLAGLALARRRKQ